MEGLFFEYSLILRFVKIPISSDAVMIDRITWLVFEITGVDW